MLRLKLNSSQMCLLALALTFTIRVSATSEAESGRKLFQKSCSACHGDNAQGGARGPNLTGELRHGASDEEILHNILNGIPGTGMPPFPMPDEEARAIVAYLGSLRKGPLEEQVKGDPQAGAKLFRGSAQCSRCHMFGGRGGRLGPDLTSIRDEKKIAELHQAIVDPDESLRPNFEPLELTFNTGAKLRGVRKNEDTFSVQVMDEQERLHLLLKKDLRAIRPIDKSLMPVPRLTAGEVDNIVAFLEKGPPDAPQLPAWIPSADLNVSFGRIRSAEEEPQNWLTYWGNLRGWRYSPLGSVLPSNVNQLTSQWGFDFGGSYQETTPLVVDGLMFVTGPSNDAAALDARTGRPVWRYHRALPKKLGCVGPTNRGFAVLGDRLFMGTLDAHLAALDAKTGNVIWDVVVDDYRKGYGITHAPLAVDGKIFVGETGGECSINGFVDAYDAVTGKRLWRFWTIPGKGDPARETWAGDSADYGGGATWMTGTYDVETHTLFWTVGNPSSDYNGSGRAGDNLYTCSVLALDPDTGKLKWHFQFTPHDTHDWDANEAPVLIDAVFRGRKRKLLVQANRNAFFYVLDRETGEFLLGKPFARQTWAKGLDEKGRPIVIAGTEPSPQGTYVCPDGSGAVNWAPSSYSPRTGLFYVAAREACAVYTASEPKPLQPGEQYMASAAKGDPKIAGRGAIRAIDPLTGDVRWEFPLYDVEATSGVLSTSGNLVFAYSGDANVIALDARSGKELWHFPSGSTLRGSPISYSVDGRQFIAVVTDSAVLTFALPLREEAERSGKQRVARRSE
jgi:PQQ-dependent dehydrogenase (methanol/ethanol family)